jgi:hypothetical protein
MKHEFTPVYYENTGLCGFVIGLNYVILIVLCDYIIWFWSLFIVLVMHKWNADVTCGTYWGRGCVSSGSRSDTLTCWYTRCLLLLHMHLCMLTSYLGVRRERAGPEGAVCHVDGHPSVADCLYNVRQVCSSLRYISKDGKIFFPTQWRTTPDSYTHS